MIEANKGSVRAAQKIVVAIERGLEISIPLEAVPHFARIIDEETGLSVLLAAAKKLIELPAKKDVFVEKLIKSAITKAEGRDT